MIETFDLTTKEIARLGLSKKQGVDWWGRDNVPINDRVDFYYLPSIKQGEGLSNPLELVPVYPACLLIRETTTIGYDDTRVKTSVRIDGLPDRISRLSFSHYLIGNLYEQIIQLGLSNSSRLQKKVECAPITFLKKKKVK